MSNIKFYHVMIRVSDPEKTIAFFNLLGLKLTKKIDEADHRYSLYYLAVPGDEDEAQIELTHNWDENGYDKGRNFGHIAFHTDDIYTMCQKLADAGITINRPPRDGCMAFVKTPDNISIELLQRKRLPPQEPWASMPNVGDW